MSDAGKWCYSFDEEMFEGRFDTMEEAIDNAKCNLEDEDDDDIEVFYIGQCQPIYLGVHTGAIIDRLGDQAYDQAGAPASDFLWDVSREHEEILEKRLNAVIDEWLKEFNYTPDFYTVTNVVKVNRGSQSHD
jgi:hypothetical protein